MRTTPSADFNPSKESTISSPFWPVHAPARFFPPQTSLFYNLEVSARRYPDKPALIYYGTSISYAELLEDVLALAGYLQNECGVQRGDRVAVFMQNAPQFLIAFYAILRAEGMVVPVSPMLLERELAHILQDSGARTIFVADDLLPRVLPLKNKGVCEHIIRTRYADYLRTPFDLPLPKELDPQFPLPSGAEGLTAWTDALAGKQVPEPHRAGPEDFCVLPYTSGTTGLPKGCIHTHASVMFTTAAPVVWHSGNHADQVVLGTLPLFHVTAMQNANSIIYIGATMVLMARWDRDVAAALIDRYRVVGWTNITTMLVDFMANPNLSRYNLSSLLRIGGGGAAVPEAVATRLQDLTGLQYVEGYGATETMAPSHVNPPERPKKQCLGIPFFNTDSRVIDPDTLQVLPAGQIGEIITHGPQVFKGYWNDPEKTKLAFVTLDNKVFFRTGDLGYRDEEGYFFLTDRLKRMINASGMKVWPAEVESMLYAHPGVQEACVVAAHDPHRGETVKAYVVLRADCEPVTQQSFIDWSKGQMAAYKYPRLVEFVDSLPKSGTGKVLWRVLQEQENEKKQ